jgi:hypothetical protein
MPCPTRCSLTTALFGVLALFAQGCGQGIYSHMAVADDAGQPPDSDWDPLTGTEAGISTDPDADPDVGPDAGPDAGADAGPYVGVDADPNGGIDLGDGGVFTQKVVGNAGADLILDGATLHIGPGTIPQGSSVLVTLRELPSIDHKGAYGPVFEISVPSAGLFRQAPTLTLPLPLSPSIGTNQQYLALGMLDPSQSAAIQQWVPVSDSRQSADQTSVTGSVTAFGNASVLDYSLVVNCTTPGIQCRAHEACNGGACQQCPTGSQCTP